MALLMQAALATPVYLAAAHRASEAHQIPAASEDKRHCDHHGNCARTDNELIRLIHSTPATCDRTDKCLRKVLLSN